MYALCKHIIQHCSYSCSGICLVVTKHILLEGDITKVKFISGWSHLEFPFLFLFPFCHGKNHFRFSREFESPFFHLIPVVSVPIKLP